MPNVHKPSVDPLREGGLDEAQFEAFTQGIARRVRQLLALQSVRPVPQTPDLRGLAARIRPEVEGLWVVLNAASWGATGGGQQPEQLARVLLERGWGVVMVQTRSEQDYKKGAGTEARPDRAGTEAPPRPGWHGGPPLRSLPENLALLSPFDVFPDCPHPYPAQVDHPDLPALVDAFRRFFRRLPNPPRKVCCCLYPTPLYLALTELLQGLGYTTAYHLLDDWETFQECGRLAALPYVGERPLLAAVDHVFAVSQVLIDKFQVGNGRRAVPVVSRPIHHLPNGVNLAAFPFQPHRPRGKALTVGYWGTLNAGWVDLGLVHEAARRRPGWQFELIGAPPPRPAAPANVHYLGAVRQDQLAALATHWNVALIPFRGPVAHAADPIKVYEYLAVGLPVVATGVPAVEGLPGVTLVAEGDVDAFVEALKAAARTDPDRDRAGREFAEAHTWSARADQLLEIVSPLPDAAKPAAVSPGAGQARLTLAEAQEILTAMETRIREGLFQPDVATLRVFWWIGTSCNYRCPYCQFRVMDTQPKQYTPTVALAAWNRWTERYGPAQIICSGLEPTHGSDNLEILAELSRQHLLDINTNFSFALADLDGFPRPDHVYFSTSYHPTSAVPLEAFLEKVEAVQQRGFHVTGVSCVLYPPHLRDMPGYKEAIEDAGLYFLAHPFHGRYQGREYPRSYTREELTLVRVLLNDDSWNYSLQQKDTSGLLCWTGARYFGIGYQGQLLRCPRIVWRGNFFTNGVSLNTYPEPCASAAGCFCNDLWRYILTEQEVEALRVVTLSAHGP